MNDSTFESYVLIAQTFLRGLSTVVSSHCVNCSWSITTNGDTALRNRAENSGDTSLEPVDPAYLESKERANDEICRLTVELGRVREQLYLPRARRE